MNRNHQISFMVAVGFLLTVIIGMNARQTILRLIDMNTWEVHTYRVLNKTQQLQALLTHLDNDLRGHLLSNHPYFKADFERTSRIMGQELLDITALTIDNPAQTKRLNRLNSIFQHKLIQSQSLLTTDRIEQGRAHLDSIERFLALSNRFQQILAETQASENSLLTQRMAASKRSASQALLSNLVGAGAALGMILWAIYLLYGSLQQSKRLNQQLAEREQQTKRLLEAVPVPVVIVDQHGQFNYANQAATQLMENITEFKSYADFVRSAQLFRYPSGEIYPLDQRPTYRSLRGEAVQVDDLELRVNDKAVQLLTSSSPVYNAQGQLQYVITTSIDISERVQSHQRLAEAKKMAEAAAKVKEDFLANMSHEIRTPLNAMLGFSELIETTNLDEEQQEYIRLIRTAGKNLLTIVNDILDIAKIDAGQIKLEAIPFSIQLLTASLQTMCAASAADKGLALSVEVDPALPTVFLGDPTRLTQILLNLLTNALKFTKQGYIRLQVDQVTDTPSDSRRVRFQVEDTGIGIASQKLTAIFERFQQADNFTTRYYGGTGLGLHIVKALTELQGGTVSVTSAEGQGSRFVVELPYKIGLEQIRLNQQPLWAAPLSQQNVWVLVVEDNLMNQRLVHQVLKRFGYQVQMADNGQIALQMLAETSFDVILMDLQMPVLDGYETTRLIRSQLKLTVPIIAMTAHALPSEKEACLKAGMNDFLSKPFQLDELQQVLRSHLPNRQPLRQVLAPIDAVPVTDQHFSPKAILALVDNNRALAIELLELFLTETPPTLDLLQQALDPLNVAEIKRVLHMQKPHTKLLNLGGATRLIGAIEERMRNQQDMGEVASLVAQYIREVKAELPAIRQYVQASMRLVSGQANGMALFLGVLYLIVYNPPF